MEQIVLYYEVARERLQSQEALTAEYGSKATGILGIGLAMLTATAIILSISSVPLSIVEPVIWIISFLAVAFVYTAGHCIWLLQPHCWERGPKIPTLAKHLSAEHTDGILTEWVGDAYRDSVEANKQVLLEKAYALERAVLGLCAEALLLSVAAVLSLWA